MRVLVKASEGGNQYMRCVTGEIVNPAAPWTPYAGTSGAASHRNVESDGIFRRRATRHDQWHVLSPVL